MAEKPQIQGQDSIPVSKPTRWVFIGPPFNTGRLVEAGAEIPVAFCEHIRAAPMKRFAMKISKAGTGMSLEGIISKFRERLTTKD